MMRLGLLAGLGVLAVVPGVWAAGELTVVPDEFVSCTTCHGLELGGNQAVAAPRVAGLPGWYVRQQLEAFKRGWRGTHEDDDEGLAMQPQAALLDKRGMRRAVAFAGAVSPSRPMRTVATEGADARRGEALYVSCGACHGVRGEGNAMLMAPPLAGLEGWYLAGQLQKFRRGERGYAADDLGGLQMRNAATVLDDDAAVADVVAYIATLPTGGR